MAGQRGRSGRKSDVEIAHLRALIDKAVSEEEWLQVIRGLVGVAMNGEKGSVQAAGLLFSYRFGNPTQYIGTREGEEIEIKTITVNAGRFGGAKARPHRVKPASGTKARLGE